MVCVLSCPLLTGDLTCHLPELLVAVSVLFSPAPNLAGQHAKVRRSSPPSRPRAQTPCHELMPPEPDAVGPPVNHRRTMPRRPVHRTHADQLPVLMLYAEHPLSDSAPALMLVWVMFPGHHISGRVS